MRTEAILLIRCNCFEMWWPGTELNRRRQPFQGCALPPELPGHVSKPADPPRATRVVRFTPIVAGLPTECTSSLSNACGTFLIIAMAASSLNVEDRDRRCRLRFRWNLSLRVLGSGPVETGQTPYNTTAAGNSGFGLLSSRRRAVLSQPRRELRLLLRLQIDAVVDAFDRLPVGPLRRLDLVSGVKIRDLVAHVSVAEAAGRSDNLGAGKRSASFLHRIPVRENEVPGQFLSGRISHHARYQPQRILRANLGRDRVVQRSLQKLRVAELGQGVEVHVVLLWGLGVFQRGHQPGIERLVAVQCCEPECSAGYLAIH